MLVWAVPVGACCAMGVACVRLAVWLCRVCAWLGGRAWMHGGDRGRGVLACVPSLCAHPTSMLRATVAVCGVVAVLWHGCVCIAVCCCCVGL